MSPSNWSKTATAPALGLCLGQWPRAHPRPSLLNPALLTLLALTLCSSAGAQSPHSKAPTTQGLNSASLSSTEQDYQRMLRLLGIESVRRGRQGRDPKSPYYVNYDEAKANPFPQLPNPLCLKSGQQVSSPQLWWKQRRPEIVEDFEREVYGRMPPVTPKVDWELLSARRQTNGSLAVLSKHLLGHVQNSNCPQISVEIDLTVCTPAEAAGPVPVILQLAFAGLPQRARGTNAVGPTNSLSRAPSAESPPSWKDLVLAKGWGYAVLLPTTVQADNGAGLTQGIIGLCNKGQPRKADDWGALRAWAWGASRVLDYFETDKALDARHVAIQGHSRYGKAALVAMAFEPRWKVAFISSSGEGGAKLHRRDWGETVENVAASSEYHWMAGNFIKYAGPLHWNDLPVDSHELIALCAPRPVYVGAGSTNGDAWVDAKGMFLATAGAGPVYRLLGKADLGTSDFPPLEHALLDGELAFRQHSGGHTDAQNWPSFLQFAQRYLAESPKAHTSVRTSKKWLIISGLCVLF